MKISNKKLNNDLKSLAQLEPRASFLRLQKQELLRQYRFAQFNKADWNLELASIFNLKSVAKVFSATSAWVVVVFVLITSGWGVVLAARTTYPGQTLYGVKLNLEKASALIVPSKKRWQHQLLLASNRLSEMKQVSIKKKAIPTSQEVALKNQQLQELTVKLGDHLTEALATFKKGKSDLKKAVAAKELNQAVLEIESGLAGLAKEAIDSQAEVTSNSATSLESSLPLKSAAEVASEVATDLELDLATEVTALVDSATTEDSQLEANLDTKVDPQEVVEAELVQEVELKLNSDLDKVTSLLEQGNLESLQVLAEVVEQSAEEVAKVVTKGEVSLKIEAAITKLKSSLDDSAVIKEFEEEELVVEPVSNSTTEDLSETSSQPEVSGSVEEGTALESQISELPLQNSAEVSLEKVETNLSSGNLPEDVSSEIFSTDQPPLESVEGEALSIEKEPVDLDLETELKGKVKALEDSLENGDLVEVSQGLLEVQEMRQNQLDQPAAASSSLEKSVLPEKTSELIESESLLNLQVPVTEEGPDEGPDEGQPSPASISRSKDLQISEPNLELSELEHSAVDMLKYKD